MTKFIKRNNILIQDLNYETIKTEIIEEFNEAGDKINETTNIFGTYINNGLVQKFMTTATERYL